MVQVCIFERIVLYRLQLALIFNCHRVQMLVFLKRALLDNSDARRKEYLFERCAEEALFSALPESFLQLDIS